MTSSERYQILDRPLKEAARNGNLNEVIRLVRQGAFYISALNYAAALGHLEIVKYLIEWSKKAPVNDLNGNRKTDGGYWLINQMVSDQKNYGLRYSAGNDYFEIVKLLLPYATFTNGQDINSFKHLTWLAKGET